MSAWLIEPDGTGYYNIEDGPDEDVWVVPVAERDSLQREVERRDKQINEALRRLGMPGKYACDLFERVWEARAILTAEFIDPEALTEPDETT